MSGIIRTTPVVHPLEGINPELWGISNYLTAGALALNYIASFVNQVLSKRLKCHFSWCGDEASTVDPENVIRVLIRTSPNVFMAPFGTARLRVRLVLSAVRDDATALPDPFIAITATDVTGARTGVATPPATHNTHRDLIVGPDNYHYIDVDLDANTARRNRTYEISLTTHDGCHIVGCSIYEVPPRALDAAEGDTIAELDPWYVGGRVYDGPLQNLWDAMTAAWDLQGSVFFAWCPMHGDSLPEVTVASFTNPFDANAAWAAGAYGFWCWPELQGQLHTNTVGVVVWAIVEPNATGTAQFMGAVQFVTNHGSGDIVIGQIDVQNYQPLVGGSPTAVTIALQTTWPFAAAQASAKVDVLMAHYGATGIQLLGCGMYAKEPLDPRSIDGLAVWLEAENITGVAGGGAVATWTDKSGNGNHATQATGANQPTLQLGVIGGRPAVRFDGTNDFMSVADSATYKSGEVTVFLVAQVTGTAADMIAVCYPHDVTHTSPFYRWAIDFSGTFTIKLIVASDVESFVSDFGTRQLMRGYTYHSDYRAWYRDGVSQHELAAGPPTITYPNAVGLRIGGDAVGGNPFQGDIAAILIYDRHLDFDERAAVEEMLSEKYGLQRSSMA